MSDEKDRSQTRVELPPAEPEGEMRDPPHGDPLRDHAVPEGSAGKKLEEKSGK